LFRINYGSDLCRDAAQTKGNICISLSQTFRLDGGGSETRKPRFPLIDPISNFQPLANCARSLCFCWVCFVGTKFCPSENGCLVCGGAVVVQKWVWQMAGEILNTLSLHIRWCADNERERETLHDAQTMMCQPLHLLLFALSVYKKIRQLIV
jgi:hypothetical protein